MSVEYTATKEYKFGQQAYEQGKSFLDNPYHPWTTQDQFFSWSKGWWERNHYYENLSRQQLIKEDEILNEIVFKEQEAKRKDKEIEAAEKRHAQSRKGKAEAAGQATLF